jgi:hypothetical protein
MREVVFRVVAERSGHLEARAESLPLRIAAPTLEELQHEAREALIEHLGPAHCTYRVRIVRQPSQPAAGGRPPGRTPVLCG